MKYITQLYRKLVIGDFKETDNEPDVKLWKTFIEKLPLPKDCIDSSYNKYLCRCYHFPKYKTAILNVASIPQVIRALFSIVGRKEPLSLPEKGKLLIEEKIDVSYKDIIPDELYEQFPKVEVVLNSRTTGEITRADYCNEGKQLFLQVIKRHPFSFYYLTWVSRELRKHSQYLKEYSMEGIVVYIEERNISGPILRELYEMNNRQFISFMHGEYLLRLIQGYMSFTQYYIWDKSYEDMFSKELRCDIGKYIVYKPRKLKKKWNFEGIIPKYYCTYYFSAESKQSIRKLGEIFNNLAKQGKRCKVRPHPRYSQWEIIKEVFPNYMIENPSEISIEESLKSTRYVIGLATTVLSEAYYEGKEIVIDDVTSPEKYNNLENRHFISLHREHILLSDLLNQD